MLKFLGCRYRVKPLVLALLWPQIARMVHRTATGEFSGLPPWFFAIGASAASWMFARKIQELIVTRQRVETDDDG